ncbi:N utilization substance protein B [Natronocella acetinitrilica]|uniref:Transcription antitermination protein NusB n=1 Tax=Natronocella acetinitrilica TaxID=414046 RepID=A0AAE3KC89_9GAMM|nr:transcription antitermination factor NusB [Natronocella acetinitrilica]MCP1676610.1 N utilization substance protein B [Natronocella acetinitrilica]
MARNRQTLGKARSRARERALQALYQWQHTGQSGADIERQFLPEAADAGDSEALDPDRDTELEDALDMSDTDIALFRELLHGVLDRMEDWDERIAPHLDRAIRSLDPTERLILRLGAFELSERIDVPYRVVINEYVELAKRFGGQDGYKYINGVLDKVARGFPLREAEIAARGRSAP